MISPPLLIGFALLFWGWQTDRLLVAVPMAVVVEMSRRLPYRWAFRTQDLARFWNLSVLIFVGSALYAFTAHEGAGAMVGFFDTATSLGERSEALKKATQSLLIFFQWVPISFFPIFLAQVYGTQDRIPYRVFSWWLRRKENLRGEKAEREIEADEGGENQGLNISYLYFSVVLLGASASMEVHSWFYASLIPLLGAALFWNRPRRYPPVVFWCSLGLVAFLGFAAHTGWNRLQVFLTNYQPSWMTRVDGTGFSPLESRTAIGHLGRMKSSGRIVMRVWPVKGATPQLLQEASYDQFNGSVWQASERDFQPLFPDSDLLTWPLLLPAESGNSIQIARYLNNGQGLLAVPPGTGKLEDLRADEVSTNRFGTVKVSGAPGLVTYGTSFDPAVSREGPPTTSDLEVPIRELPAVTEIGKRLGLKTLARESPRKAATELGRFFSSRFNYSLYQETRREMNNSELTHLAYFLKEGRRGHCEYFATASVLLLRQAGIPARYAVGYAVQERAGSKYLVRSRHAHAWALAWIDGKWEVMDNTPGSWFEEEAQRASWWEAVHDAGSWAWFQFSRLRWSQTAYRQWLFWGAIPVLLLAGLRLLFKARWSRQRIGNATKPSLRLAGTDSELYELEQFFVKRGRGRIPEETWTDWMLRMKTDLQPGQWKDLRDLVWLHYRYRFDPVGLDEADRQQLRRWAEDLRIAVMGQH